MGATTVRIGPLGATFAAVAMPDLRAEPEVGADAVRFVQTTGGRTALPAPRRIATPPFLRLQSPLVWTTLALTLHADGRVETRLAGASPFPRHWVYDEQDRLAAKAGTTDYLAWLGQPGVAQTPWGAEDSPVVVTAAETALERDLSAVIMRSGRRPRVRSYDAGETVLRQGDPGDSLLLLLDGVLSVAVDGAAIAEIGPGAVVGERAVLDGGVRTATLRAVTRVRVAEAPVDGHHREVSAG